MTTRIVLRDSAFDDAQLRAELEAWRIPDGTAFDPAAHAHCTLIQTTNSIYLYLVTGPGERRGLLVGGAVGECPVTASLLGVIPAANDAPKDASRLSTSSARAEDVEARLTTGTRAVFIVESGYGWKRVITSRIVTLARTRIRSREFLATRH